MCDGAALRRLARTSSRQLVMRPVDSLLRCTLKRQLCGGDGGLAKHGEYFFQENMSGAFMASMRGSTRSANWLARASCIKLK